ncbi:hypothetical protein TWF481_010645 [Arthrobotrys musiformis]|uniref:Uncharacterized protein n=1 Tax=Arthrobotrys musiformis TaxID=47236 RepID=A0AAV9W3J5_9PEZI
MEPERAVESKQRQLWFATFESKYRNEEGHPSRFDHWAFFLPETPVQDWRELRHGRVLQVAGSPYTGFSPYIENINITEMGTSKYFAEMVMESIDLEVVTRKANAQPGFPSEEKPITGRPNCQGWLFLLAVACVEDKIMDKSVVTHLLSRVQK